MTDKKSKGKSNDKGKSRSFDRATRVTTASGFAQDDNFYLQSII